MIAYTAILPDRSTHIRGLMLGFTASICFTFGGPVIRLLEEADGWQFLAWRSITFAAVSLAVALLCTGPAGIAREMRRLGWMGPAIAMVLGGGMAAYVFAMLTTTVANVELILGSGPLFTAFLAWAVLGERLSGRGFVALLAAVLGVTVMFGDGLGGVSVIGHSMSLLAMICYSAYVVLLRLARGADTFVASALGGLFAAGLSVIMAGGELAIPAADVMLCVFSGIVQIGIGFISMAARYLPAAEVTLLVLSATVLGPLWVWLIVNEVPSLLTLIGGTIVLASVLAYGLFALNDDNRRATTEMIDSGARA